MFQGFFDNLLALLRDQDGPWAHFKNIVSNAWTHIKNVFTPVYEHLKENIKEYNFKIEENEKNNIDIDSKFHFNLGIILLNLFIINRRYKNVQKANK